ncbi:MAG: Asp-tRNA(Asn)/Glu-tRNA(Gln) amidotransferase subunit GatB [Acidobacteria bacterium]|nr:MAG: Asp-tRNA(Asn)/Glu-tRNA(Gln) amidotransferase subunit GatB [Acidobacteriota bacterium]
MSYVPVIGLEIHAQLLTATKIFCGCRTSFGAPPNTNVCPVCLGLPGALPVLNRRAVDLAVRAALALECQVHHTSVFARKNYFYPDLPKGYQISQYEQPLATGGRLRLSSGKYIRITRIHMEEDAGKSLHGLADSASHTHIDLNRAGTPLIEIVSEPDVRSAAEAAEYFSRMRELLVSIGACDGNMEEGSLRCDANVSIRADESAPFGTRTETKNVNSFRFLEQAIAFEIDRQIDVVSSGGTVIQETRLFDNATGRTESMRSKEDAHDYRYFPEPDLAPLVVTEAWVEAARAALPELPDAKTARFVSAYGLSDYDANLLVRLIPGGADYFEATVAAGASAKGASNWILGELRRILKDAGGDDMTAVPVEPIRLSELIVLAETDVISSTVAKDVLSKMWVSGRGAKAIVDAEGLAQVGDSAALQAAIGAVLAENADAVAQYRAGKSAAFGFLVGQAMKAMKGKANPKAINALLKSELEKIPN